MHRNSKVNSKRDSLKAFPDDNSEVNQLNKKLKDLEDLYNKLKKNNEGMKSDYEKQKYKFAKVKIIRTIDNSKRS